MTNEIAISNESITIKSRPNGEATAGCSIKLGPKASQILKFRALRRLAREIRDRTAYPAAKPTRKEITLVVTSSILPDQQQGCSVCYLVPYNFICLNPTGRYAGTLGSCSQRKCGRPSAHSGRKPARNRLRCDSYHSFFEAIVVQTGFRLQPLSVWGRAISNRSARGRSYFSGMGGPTSI